MALRVRGESVDEIAGAVRAMRAKMTKVEAPEGAIDIVGTGGDASGTYNISTCAAFVVAGGGVPVAKHGNRALSSKSGSADVLATLGVKHRPAAGEDVRLHPRGRHRLHDGAEPPCRDDAMSAPRAPSSAPARCSTCSGRYAIRRASSATCSGSIAREWVEPVAGVLASLGAEAAWVVHGTFGDGAGLDELSLTGTSYVAELKEGRVRPFQVEPIEFGVDPVAPEAILGGTPDANAKALRRVLEGELGPFRDVVVMNAGAAFMVAGKAALLMDAADLARQSIDSGAALKALDRLVAVSNS